MRSLLTVILALLFISTFAQKKKDKIQDTQNTAPIPDSLFKDLRWRNAGPFRGGRSNTISGVVNNDQRFYAGYTGGGVWRTDDAGISWHNISDNFFKTGSIGMISVSESDPNVVYVGTGEHAVRGVMTSYGDGGRLRRCLTIRALVKTGAGEGCRSITSRARVYLRADCKI